MSQRFSNRPEIWDPIDRRVVPRILRRRNQRIEERNSGIATVAALIAVLGIGGLWVNVLVDPLFGDNDGVKLLTSLMLIPILGVGAYQVTKRVLKRR